MQTRTRIRTGVAVGVSVGAAALAVTGLWTVYGFAVEYGGGSFTDLAFLVVPIPVVMAALAVVTWPRVTTGVQVGVVLGTLVVMVGGGLVADDLGRRTNRERLVEGSESFTCNGRNAEVRVPAEVDATWRALPRRAPIYGPIGGTATSCTAGVSGPGDRAFTDYTATFRRLEGWRVRVDEESRFVMVRDDVRVSVRKLGAPDRLATIEVGLTR